MKSFFALCFAIITFASSSVAKDAVWMTDFEAARARAEKEGKPILVNFTGSDFCPPCIMLSKEVFDTPEFKKFAGENIVLMEVDFPKDKPQSPSLVNQNAMLAAAFNIPGYPSIYLVTHDLKVITPRLGYYPGGAEVWVDGLKKYIAASK